ncbi:hypothetical protein GCM10007301_50070 [Azorhizobium oxalatiphilum]|uniref:TonB C-terminal domain-containing protein n=2 Tax=Azorhizobium oxalatiphilum TaxID=980631 RepID=A0A917CCW6_9HYPH|nr:hypothetical protein GCM10007301_50070 [Azorhizobium oxalatiphilum]
MYRSDDASIMSRRALVGGLFATLTLTTVASAQSLRQPATPTARPAPAPSYAPTPAPTYAPTPTYAPSRDYEPSSTPPRNRQEWTLAAWRIMAHYQDVPEDMPDRQARLETHVSFKLRRDGTLVDADITKSSGRPQLDDSVMGMVARSAPFPPLPDDMNPNRRINLPVVFEYVQDPDQERYIIDADSARQTRELMDRRRIRNGGWRRGAGQGLRRNVP